MNWDGTERRKSPRRSLVARRTSPERRIINTLVVKQGFGFDTALRNAGFKGTILADWMPWHGDGHYHPGVPYSQNDDRIIGLQLDVMQAVGIQGVRATWQGPATSGARAFGHQATQKMCKQLAARGMKFVLLLDPWICKQQADPQKAMIDALNHPDTQAMLASSAYVPEKYVCDFVGKQPVANSTGAKVTLDWSKISSAASSVVVLARKTGYTWPELVTTDAKGNTIPLTEQQSIAVLKSQNANPSVKMAAVCKGFFDGGWLKSDGSIDWTQQDWSEATSTGPTRMMEDCAGKYFYDQLAVTPLDRAYVVWATWNDYNERTAIEPYASMITGKGIF